MTDLDADKLTAILAGCRLARQITVLEEITSTNDVVMAAAREGAGEGVVVFAKTQTAGRGRLGRKWHSAPGKGLWFSLLLRPRFSRPFWVRLTTWAGVAVAEAIEQTVPCRVMMKWPNDLQIGGKKVAGILIETGMDKMGAPFAALGVGVNANHEGNDFLPEIVETAGSLRQMANRSVDVTDLAAAILWHLDNSHPRLESDFAEIIASATTRSSLIGRKIQIRAGTELIEGTVRGLDGDGGLILVKSDGREFVAMAGDVTVVKAG